MLDLYRPSLTGARNLTATDVIANNIANVQTPEFRATLVEFSDLLYRQLAPEDIGLPPDDTSVLPTVGTGVSVLATTPSQRPGAQVPTARPSPTTRVAGVLCQAIWLISGALRIIAAP